MVALAFVKPRLHALDDAVDDDIYDSGSSTVSYYCRQQLRLTSHNRPPPPPPPHFTHLTHRLLPQGGLRPLVLPSPPPQVTVAATLRQGEVDRSADENCSDGRLKMSPHLVHNFVGYLRPNGDPDCMLRTSTANGTSGGSGTMLGPSAPWCSDGIVPELAIHVAATPEK